MIKAVAIIPARYGSTRFPGKALADIHGKTLIQHVYERVSLSSALSQVVVATDDKRIAQEVEHFGGTAVMTSPDHKSGTDRVVEASKITGGDIIINVQGDEPLIDPALIDALIEKIVGDSEIVCSTAAFPISDKEMYLDQNNVKVVLDLKGRALYFSHSPLPFFRASEFSRAYIHIGIYCFRRDFLELYSQFGQTPLEDTEKLEQLRILENGYKIGVVVTDHESIGVDTEADLEQVKRFMNR